MRYDGMFLLLLFHMKLFLRIKISIFLLGNFMHCLVHCTHKRRSLLAESSFPSKVCAFCVLIEWRVEWNCAKTCKLKICLCLRLDANCGCKRVQCVLFIIIYQTVDISWSSNYYYRDFVQRRFLLAREFWEFCLWMANKM